MRKRTQDMITEHDLHRLPSRATLARVEQCRELVAELQEILTTPELANANKELFELLNHELEVLCCSSRDTGAKRENVSPEFLLGYMDGVADAFTLAVVERQQTDPSR